MARIEPIAWDELTPQSRAMMEAGTATGMYTTTVPLQIVAYSSIAMKGLHDNTKLRLKRGFSNPVSWNCFVYRALNRRRANPARPHAKTIRFLKAMLHPFLIQTSSDLLPESVPPCNSLTCFQPIITQSTTAPFGRSKRSSRPQKSSRWRTCVRRTLAAIDLCILWACSGSMRR
jgi:hypothetical protein